MSYCRFSSLNWGCDVYVYEDTYGGWTTHVAGRRRLFRPIPDLPFWVSNNFPNLWTFWHNHVHMAMLKFIPLRKIGLPYDGRTLSEETALDCARVLEALRFMGYRVPKSVIKTLREEKHC